MHKFDPANMDRLLGDQRRQWQDPEKTLSRLGLGAGMVFADIGCGPGFFALPAARIVGDTGEVLALDINQSMLDRLQALAAQEGLGQVRTVRSQEDHLPIADAVTDRALLSNVLHETHGQVAFLREIHRVLKPGGMFAVVEWRKEHQEMGPPFEERLAEETVEGLLTEAGFTSLERFDAGPRHYGIQARA